MIESRDNFVNSDEAMSKDLILTNRNEMVRVSPERIAYIISDGNYSSMVLTNGEKYVFSFNLATFERIIERQLADETRLFRLGKRLIINGEYIYYINIAKQQIILSGSGFPMKFILNASKIALRMLKASLEENIRTTSDYID